MRKERSAPGRSDSVCFGGPRASSSGDGFDYHQLSSFDGRSQARFSRRFVLGVGVGGGGGGGGGGGVEGGVRFCGRVTVSTCNIEAQGGGFGRGLPMSRIPFARFLLARRVTPLNVFPDYLDSHKHEHTKLVLTCNLKQN